MGISATVKTKNMGESGSQRKTLLNEHPYLGSNEKCRYDEKYMYGSTKLNVFMICMKEHVLGHGTPTSCSKAVLT